MDREANGGQWRFRHEMVAPENEVPGFHVSNHGIARVVFEARNRYFDSLSVEGGIWYGPVTPVIREVLLRYESEVMSGAPVVGAVAIVSRSRRSFVMEESVTDLADPAAARLIAIGHSIHVTVDSATRAVVEIPGWLLDVLEGFQGAPIPLRS
jgi:acyl-CoA thioesterase FadM